MPNAKEICPWGVPPFWGGFFLEGFPGTRSKAFWERVFSHLDFFLEGLKSKNTQKEECGMIFVVSLV